MMMNGRQSHNQPSKSSKMSSRMNPSMMVPAGSGASLPISPMRTVSKQAQRRAAQRNETSPRGANGDESFMTNNGKKHLKGKRGHKEEEDTMNEWMPDTRRDDAIDRINNAIDGYATRVAAINTRAKSRPSSAHIDSDDAYGQRKASGASNYHRDATLGVDGQLKSAHLVREVQDTLTRGERRMKRDELRNGEEGVIDRLNKMADHLSPATINHDAAHNSYANGHEQCMTHKHTRHTVHAQPHRARRAATRGLIAHGEVHGAEAIGHSGSAADNSLRFLRAPHNHSYDLDLSA